MSEEIGRQIKNIEAISIPELYNAMKDLEDLEGILPIQKRTLEYLKKFKKLDFKKAIQVKRRLMEIDEVDEEKAVQIINILPRSIEEIKEIFHEKVIIKELAEKILSVLRDEGLI